MIQTRRGGVRKFDGEKISEIAEKIVDILQMISLQISENLWTSMKEIFEELLRIFYEHFNYSDESTLDKIDDLEAKLEGIRESRDIFHRKAHVSSKPEDSKTEDRGTPAEAHTARKPGYYQRFKNWLTGSKQNEETKKLLMDLKALEMSIDQL